MRSDQSPRFTSEESRVLFGTESPSSTSSRSARGARRAAADPASRPAPGQPTVELNYTLGGDHRLSRFVHVLVLLAIMWVVEIVDTILPLSLDHFSLQGWNPLSLYGLVTSPFLHGSFSHLVANTFPFILLGIFIAFEGARRFWFVTVVTGLIAGAGAWLTTFSGAHIVGASGIIYGYFGYLAMRTWYTDDLVRRIIYFAIGLFVFVTYGASMVFGMFPQAGNISWQSHLFGFIAGVLVARFIHRREAAA